MDNPISKSEYYKITLTISDDLDQLLMKIGNTARMQKGHKLPRTMIIRALISLLNDIEVDVSGVKTEKEFIVRLKKALHLEHET